jgi:hypothetical protein
MLAILWQHPLSFATTTATTTTIADYSNYSTSLSLNLYLCRHRHRCHHHRPLNDDKPNDIVFLVFCSFYTYNLDTEKKEQRTTPPKKNNGRKVHLSLYQKIYDIIHHHTLFETTSVVTMVQINS